MRSSEENSKQELERGRRVATYGSSLRPVAALGIDRDSDCHVAFLSTAATICPESNASSQ